MKKKVEVFIHKREGWLGFLTKKKKDFFKFESNTTEGKLTIHYDERIKKVLGGKWDYLGGTMRDNWGVLENKKVITFKTIEEYIKHPLCNQNRTVKKTEKGEILVSTVFLMVNHGHCGDDEWFETMVFGGDKDEYCERYEAYDEAIEGHGKIVGLVLSEGLLE